MADSNIQEKKFLFSLFIAAIIAYGIYQFFWNKDIEEKGIYSKGLVTNSESTKGGALITVKYKYLARQYESVLPSDLGKAAIGRQYFIQFNPGDPKAIVFHRDQPVPDCLINVEAPSSGWDKIPACP